MTPRNNPGRSSKAYIDLDKIHFVFRGSPTDTVNITKMIEQMRTTGLLQLDSIANTLVKKKVLAHFNKQIDMALNAVQNGITKTLPIVGELMVFQGKTPGCGTSGYIPGFIGYDNNAKHFL